MWSRERRACSSGRTTSSGSSRRCARPRRAAASASCCWRTSSPTCSRPPPTSSSTASSGERVTSSSARDDAGSAASGRGRARREALPVDAKFPLDNVHRVLDAEDDEQRLVAAPDALAGREGARRRDRDEVHQAGRGHLRLRLHVPAGRDRLLRDRLRRHRRPDHQYALGKRVFPASPATFHAYLTMIVLGSAACRSRSTPRT